MSRSCNIGTKFAVRETVWFHSVSLRVLAGTMFFWGRYLNYPHKEQFHIIPSYDGYIIHYHASSWHHWDGRIIWFFFNRPNLFWFLLTLVTVLTIAGCFGVRKRKDMLTLGPTYSRQSVPKRGLSTWKWAICWGFSRDSLRNLWLNVLGNYKTFTLMLWMDSSTTVSHDHV